MTFALNRRSLLALGAGVAGSLVLPGAVRAVTTTAAGQVPLPAPTGPYRIGTTALRLVDRSRRDPWVPSVPYRELMISLWYPTTADGHEPARYMGRRAAAHFDEVLAPIIPGYPAGLMNWAGTPTHAGLAAPIAARRGGWPVVLHGPGGGNPRTLGTVLVEELASHGYVVVSMDHTYEASEVEFPDGRLAVDRRPEGTTRGACTEVRVADARFVLDTIAARFGAALDLRRTGMFGFSAGGFAAAQTMLADRRIRAGVNLDGRLLADDEPPVHGEVVRRGLDRPFLQIATSGPDTGADGSWDAFRANQRGWYRQLRLRDSRHLSLCDYQLSIPAIATALGAPAEAVAEVVGTIDPARSIAAQRACVVAMFDRHLRGRPAPLLDAPQTSFPEIAVVD